MVETIRSVGVIGAGQMGNGISHVCALAGINVLLQDVSEDLIQSGIATINGNLARQAAAGKISETECKQAQARVRPALTMEGIGGVDLVIEAATENEDVKKAIYAKLCPVLNPKAILATNTSSLPITRLASNTDRPERFIGIHFMNPVPLMQLVELVRGICH